MRNAFINRLKNNSNCVKEIDTDDRKRVWFSLSYTIGKRDWLSRSLMRKLNRCCNESVTYSENVNLTENVKLYKINKLALFYDTTYPIQLENKENVIYRITCLGYFNKFIGKTGRNLITRLDKHCTKPEQTMYQHLSKYT